MKKQNKQHFEENSKLKTPQQMPKIKSSNISKEWIPTVFSPVLVRAFSKKW